MQRIIQVNIGGRLIPMEDEAYTELKNYLAAVHHQFAHEQGKDEILEDIESRISELFQMCLDNQVAAITMQDVRKVADVLGAAHQLGANEQTYKSTGLPMATASKSSGGRRIYRNKQEGKIAGVCAGLADYFGIDAMLVRLGFFLAAFLALGGIITYVVCWIILPVGSQEDIAVTKAAKRPDFESIKKSVATDLADLKTRGEQMSVELKDWFNNRKW